MVPSGGQALPDAPSALLGNVTGVLADPGSAENSAPATGQVPGPQATGPGGKLPLCPPEVRGTVRPEDARAADDPESRGTGTAPAARPAPCRQESQLQPIVTSGHAIPLTRSGKAALAVRDIVDPFNLITILGYSGIAIASNSHSAYGPGFPGFGRLSGYSLVEDTQGEFFGTFLIPSLVHEDPRYRRMPHARMSRRILHAVGHTFVSQHDDGTPMPNYATLLTYPISAELSNLYVPGVATNAASTARRVGIGLATDPAGTIVAEFLPDLAKRIHIHVIFVQEILNQVVIGAPNMQ